MSYTNDLERRIEELQNKNYELKEILKEKDNYIEFLKEMLRSYR